VRAALALILLIGCVDTATEQDVAETEQASTTAFANDQAAFNFFLQKGLTNFQAAGIVGNLDQESGVSPTSVQAGGPGRGIAQWSTGGRWDSSAGDNVKAYAAQQGASMTSLNLQLEFIWFELQNFPGYGLASLKASTNVTDATVAFMAKYEVCGTCNQSGRVAYANQVLAAYGGSSGGGSTGGGGTSGGAGCYSGTLSEQVAENACVQSKYDNLWYQCSNGSWVDRWSDPAACTSVHPL